MKPTIEQASIIEAFNTSNANLLVRARAGAAKTTTLRMLIAEHRNHCLYLAFNRSVVIEARTKVAAYCKVMTLNGIGHQTLARQLGQRPDLDKSKSFKLLREAEYKGKRFGEMLRAVRLAKQYGFVDGIPQSLLTDEEFFERLDVHFNENEQAIIKACTHDGWRLAFEQGIIDFDDQILVPTLKKMSFPQTPVLFIDEAQDLSAINRLMVKRILGFGTRFIAVGDEAQAIYGFRGADHDSMDRLQQDHKMEVYKLTTTFRCSRAVTEHANWRTEDMRYRDSAPEGSVQEMDSIAFSDLPRTAAILCRNNAPLINLALRMMRAGLAPRLLCRDVLDETIKSLEFITRKAMPRAEALEAVDDWMEEKLRTWKNGGVIRDKADCMRIFLYEAENAGAAIARIRALRAAPEGNVTLSTIHKSKGNEYEHVIIIDKHLIGEGGQEDNLLYVAQTRARETLRYCLSGQVDAGVETCIKGG